MLGPTSRIAAAVLSLSVFALSPAPAHADAAADPVGILVLKENGAGSAATAQGYVDALMGQVAKVNGWSGAVGKYETKRAAAKSFISSAKPHYGILSLAAFLDLRTAAKMSVVGQAEIEGGGGMQYYVVSKTQSDLAGCKGKSLATNHGGDTKFMEKVVAAGAFAMKDFTVVATPRPVAVLKKVLKGEAECALVDDAQMAELSRLEGGAAVKPVWVSAMMPPMVVVSFASAPADEATTFKSKLVDVCKGEGKSACDAAGIKALRGGDGKPYDAVIKAYGG
jgi:ABC-type amino acid transport substrate-binding protein